MFPRTSFSSAVTDIQALLGDADPATADLDDATRAWLAHTRPAITAQRRRPGRRRAWALVPHRPCGPRRRVLAAAGSATGQVCGGSPGPGSMWGTSPGWSGIG